ncbi:hypothetical protein Pyn_13681 [Prunus yedoensis var. nudiflora]|uniref:Uncharacterized protein n=1 Tax=Prunus yedoensis var. nudiflora TaxID=2094558 RepID=A0A314YHV5_PRUYE|nr:hypothetical protein Pyn_13681 [Prunus yedoensis var. nudiflora]
MSLFWVGLPWAQPWPQYRQSGEDEIDYRSQSLTLRQSKMVRVKLFTFQINSFDGRAEFVLSCLNT